MPSPAAAMAVGVAMVVGGRRRGAPAFPHLQIFHSETSALHSVVVEESAGRTEDLEVRDAVHLRCEDKKSQGLN